MNKPDSSLDASQNDQEQKPSFWQIILSTFAAAFGVQNRKNLEKDFTHGNIKVYIVAGLIFTTAFVVVVFLLVKLVLKSSGL